jgi:cell division protein FtsB
LSLSLSGSVLEVFDALPKSLQLDISSPSAPAEAVNAVLSGDITTHKDFIAMKKQLEETQEENERLTEKNSTLESRAADLGQQNDLLREQNKKLDDENSFLDAKSCDLEAKVEVLEIELKREQKKARDVIIPDPKESQEYKTILDERNKMHRQIVATTQENDRLKDRCDELSRRNTELKNQPQITGGFDSEQLRGFFEDYYSRANDAVRNLYQFIRDGYPQDIRDYVRGRIDDLKDYIENLEAIHEEDFTV